MKRYTELREFEPHTQAIPHRSLLVLKRQYQLCPDMSGHLNGFTTYVDNAQFIIYRTMQLHDAYRAY